MNFNDFLAIVGALIVWFFITRVVFPKLGIPSCCCGDSCRIENNNNVEKGDKNV